MRVKISWFFWVAFIGALGVYLYAMRPPEHLVLIAADTPTSNPSKPAPIIVPGVYDGCSGCSKSARLVAWSMDHEKGRWTVNEFTAVRDDGLHVWIANGPAFVTIGFNERGDGDFLGGGNSDTPSPDQALIWRGYERLLPYDRLQNAHAIEQRLQNGR